MVGLALVSIHDPLPILAPIRIAPPIPGPWRQRRRLRGPRLAAWRKPSPRRRRSDRSPRRVAANPFPGKGEATSSICTWSAGRRRWTFTITSRACAQFFDVDLPDSVRMGQRLTTMTSGQARFPIAPSKFRFRQTRPVRHVGARNCCRTRRAWSMTCASSAPCTPRRSTTSRPSPTCRPATR